MLQIRIIMLSSVDISLSGVSLLACVLINHIILKPRGLPFRNRTGPPAKSWDRGAVVDPFVGVPGATKIQWVQQYGRSFVLV
jgi:hypothetical protein